MYTKKVLLVFICGCLVAASFLACNPNSTLLVFSRFNTKDIAWFFRVEGAFTSSPVDCAPLLIIQTTRSLYAIDLQSGKLAWQLSVHGSPQNHPPVCSEKAIIFSDNRGALSSVDKSTGENNWRSQLAATSGEDHLEIVDEIVLDENNVYTGRYDNWLAANSLVNGDEIWRYPVFSRFNQFLLSYNDVIFIGAGKKLLAIQKKTGELIDQLTFDGYISSTALIDERIYIAESVENGVNLRSIDVNLSNMQLLAKINTTSIGCLIPYQGSLFFSGDTLGELDIKANKILWAQPSGVPYNCPVIAEDVIYVKSNIGDLYEYNREGNLETRHVINRSLIPSINVWKNDIVKYGNGIVFYYGDRFVVSLEN
jgi:outer membrane protein assembly factor BamB